MATRLSTTTVGALAVLGAVVTGCTQPEAPDIPDPIWVAPVPEATSFSGSYVADDGVVVTQFGATSTDDEGVTVVGSLDRLAAFDLASGERLWELDLPDGSEAGPMVAAGGRLLHIAQTETDEVFVYDTRLIATDLRTGEVQWEHAGLDDSFLELAATADLAVVSSANETDFVDHPLFLDAATGAILDADRAHPSTDGLRLYSGGGHAFVAAAGRLEAYAGGSAEPVWVADGAEVGPYEGLAVHDDVVVLAGDRTRTYDLTDGTLLATIDAVPIGGAFVQGADLVGFDRRTGDELWRAPDTLDAHVSEEVDGAVAVATREGFVLLDATTGEELARAEPDDDALPLVGEVYLTPDAVYYVEVDEPRTFDSERSALVALDRDGARRFRAVGPEGIEQSGLADGLLIVANDKELVALG